MKLRELVNFERLRSIQQYNDRPLTTTGRITMAELQVMLSDEEQTYLAGLLEQMLKDTLVEEHRTRTPSYRQDVIHREDIIRALLGKLRQPAG